LGSSERVQVKIPKYRIPRKLVKPVLLNVDALLPHEEIINERLNELLKNMLELGAVDMPIIVAPIPGTKKYLIVDGHHRWAALKKLGARKVPAIVIDYFSPNVKVYTWFPGFKGDINDFLNEIKASGIKVKPIGGEGGLESLVNSCRIDGEECSFILVCRDGRKYALSGWLAGQKRVVKALDKLASEGKILMIWYGLLKDALKDLEDGAIDCLLIRRGLTKHEVMDVVRRGGVLPPKTTRHVLPFIPEKTYTKLSLLR